VAASRLQVVGPASAPQARSTEPFACSIPVGTAWHASHGSAARIVPVVTCAWWAPTAIAVVADSPVVEIGGAGFASEPWQLLQPSGPTSTVPFTWRPAPMSMPPAAVTVSG
jgi:hypothetical protein